MSAPISAVKLRQPVAADVPELGRILYEGFATFHHHHRFEPDIPSIDMGTEFMKMLTSHPAIFGVVAESGGKVIGSNFLHEVNDVRGVGPITVDPSSQARGVGKKLMQAVIERGTGATSIRLVQDAFNTASMSLYTSLGFDAKEPLALVRGSCRSKPSRDAKVRAMTADDLPQCGKLCRRIHGMDRNGELRDVLKDFHPMVLEREGEIVAYCAAPYFWFANHGVARTEQDMRELLVGASSQSTEPLWFLLPIRQASFFRWILSEGLRVMKPMTLMSMGMYQEPKGCFYPSVLF
jgi:ribosomal protein S18 acetylase RimI-like enzyme